MSYNKLKSLLDKQEDKIFVDSLAYSEMADPEIVTKAFELLSDDGCIVQLGDDKALSLFRMCRVYFDTCFTIFIDESIGQKALEKLLDYTENTLYYVQAADGERIATESEVKNGVEQLIPKPIYAVEPEIAEYLNLLMWTFTGKIRYYGRAGLEYTYDNNRLKETFYQLTVRAGNKLKAMLDWLSVGGNYDRAIAALKISKKNSRYKYPSFAKDEITPNFSPKQIYYFCSKSLTANTCTDAQIKAKKLVYMIENKKYKPLPHEIAIMRKAYSEILSGNFEFNFNNIADLEARLVCIRINELYNSKILSNADFCVKVLNTVKKTGKVSDKQITIMREALDKINAQENHRRGRKELNTSSNQCKTDLEELFEMSDALGSGKIGG